MSQDVPTLYEWAGGTEALNRLTETFYDKVLRDPVVGPVFRAMSPDHPAHVAAFIGEVLARFSADRKPTAKNLAVTARWSCTTWASI